jgi:membrane dipeptidase
MPDRRIRPDPPLGLLTYSAGGFVMTAPLPDRISRLLQAAPVFDGHNDLAWALRTNAGYDLDRCDIADPQPTLHTDIPRLRAGGVGAQFFSVFVPSDLSGAAAVTATLEQVDCVLRIVERYPDTFALARSAAQVREVMAGGRIAALLGAEGGHCIDGSLGVLRILHRLGVAYLTLTHRKSTPWADAATDAPSAGGLSGFGREVVREMNRIGMLVDISHVAPTTMREALATSSAPVIFSHSSCRAITDHVRNVPDDVLSRLAAADGVVMITFVPAFVSQACADHRSAMLAERQRLGIDADPANPVLVAEYDRWCAANPAPTATIADVADHVEHAREVAGVSHIGLGGDYDGSARVPVGLEDVSGYPRLLSELAERGWSDAELAALTCGNVLRVLSAAQENADSGFDV